MPTNKQKKGAPHRNPPPSRTQNQPVSKRPTQNLHYQQTIRRDPQRNRTVLQNGPPGSRKTSKPAPPAQRQKRPSRADASRTANIRQVQKHRRQKRKRNYTLYYIILFLFLSTTGVILSLTVFFNIEKIEVQGSEQYSQEEILSFLDIKEGDNLLRINTGEAEDTLLRELTKADQVKVSRAFPNGLKVTVTDGVPSAQLENEGSYYVISQSGRILSVGDSPEVGSGILISGIDLTGAVEGDYVDHVQERLWEEACAAAEEADEPQPEKPDDVQNLQTFFAALKTAEYSSVTAVDLTDDLSLTLYWENRIQVLLGSFSELDYKLAFAKTLLTDEQYAEIIGPDAVGILDVASTSSGVQFFPKPDLEIPGDGVSVWNWDDNLPDDPVEEESSSSDESSEASVPEESSESSLESSETSEISQPEESDAVSSDSSTD